MHKCISERWKKHDVHIRAHWPWIITEAPLKHASLACERVEPSAERHVSSKMGVHLRGHWVGFFEERARTTSILECSFDVCVLLTAHWPNLCTSTSKKRRWSIKAW